MWLIVREEESRSGSRHPGSGQAARLVAEAKAQAEAEEKAKRARKLKELEGQAISLRMYENPVLAAQVSSSTSPPTVLPPFSHPSATFLSEVLQSSFQH